MTVELSEWAVRYLLIRLETDISFYQQLVATPLCSSANRARWELIRELRDSLTKALEP